MLDLTIGKYERRGERRHIIKKNLVCDHSKNAPVSIFFNISRISHWVIYKTYFAKA